MTLRSRLLGSRLDRLAGRLSGGPDEWPQCLVILPPKDGEPIPPWNPRSQVQIIPRQHVDAVVAYHDRTGKLPEIAPWESGLPPTGEP